MDALHEQQHVIQIALLVQSPWTFLFTLFLTRASMSIFKISVQDFQCQPLPLILAVEKQYTGPECNLKQQSSLTGICYQDRRDHRENRGVPSGPLMNLSQCVDAVELVEAANQFF